MGVGTRGMEGLLPKKSRARREDWRGWVVGRSGGRSNFVGSLHSKFEIRNSRRGWRGFIVDLRRHLNLKTGEFLKRRLCCPRFSCPAYYVAKDHRYGRPFIRSLAASLYNTNDDSDRVIIRRDNTPYIVIIHRAMPCFSLRVHRTIEKAAYPPNCLAEELR